MKFFKKMIEELFYKAEHDAKLFVPKFTWSNDINEVADMINLPHEDYPLRVNKTKQLIESYLEGDLHPELHRPSIYKIFERDIKQMHSFLFEGEGYNNSHIRRGDYRLNSVSVGRHEYIPPDVLQISYLMSRITPVEIGNNDRPSFFVMDEESLIWWYRLFQTIHPFQDGNGRIGSIVVAILSYSLYRKYLMPDRQF